MSLVYNKTKKMAESIAETDEFSTEVKTDIKSKKPVKSKTGKIIKKKEAGIVYLSYIPPLMNVTKVRELFQKYGEVDRLFLQPDKPSKKGKPSKNFTEGWVEFKDKKMAKRVALLLNGQQIGGKRKSPWYDCLWSIKYLHRFKWTHLSERLAYERAVKDQRLRNEISQVKKEANFFSIAVDKSQKEKRKRENNPKSVKTKEIKVMSFSQKETDEEIRAKNKKAPNTNNTNFLLSVFGIKEKI